MALGCGGVQQGELNRFSCGRAERVDLPSLAQPLDHLLQLASLCRLVDFRGQGGGSAALRLHSVRWGGRRGGGRLWRRGVLPDELRGGCVAVDLGALQSGVAFVVEQLGVGLGAQQGLHARLLPFVSGSHQGGAAVDGLQVGVGRVLQQDEYDGEVAIARSIHERGEAEAASQVDARAPLQQHPHHLQVAVTRNGVQQGCGCGMTALTCKRAERIGLSPFAQPLDHLLQFAQLRRLEDLKGK